MSPAQELLQAAGSVVDVSRTALGVPRSAADCRNVVLIRPIRPTDRALELAFLNALSRETLYQRLMSSRKLLPGELERLTNIDRRNEIALVATVGIGRDEKQVGVVRLIRDGTGLDCEFAIVVADDWQGRGLGRRLIEALIGEARHAGYRTMWGLAFAHNARMLALGRKLGFEVQPQPDDATLRRLVQVL